MSAETDKAETGNIIYRIQRLLQHRGVEELMFIESYLRDLAYKPKTHHD